MHTFESLTEIESLPGYVARVRKGEWTWVEGQKLDRWYVFKDKVNCNRADCNKPHNTGYVVDIVSIVDGRKGVTKIGNVCGLRLFGTVFEVAVRDAQREHRRQLLRDSIAEGIAQIASRRDQARALLPAAIQLERVKLSLREACSDKLYHHLVDRAQRGEVEIIKSRKRTEHDPPARDGSHSGYIDERVGFLQGLRCLALPTPRRILEEEILGPLNRFERMTPDEIAAKASVMRWFSNWNQNADSNFKEAQDKLAQAAAFFTAENLRLLFPLAEARGLSPKRLRVSVSTGLVEGR